MTQYDKHSSNTKSQTVFYDYCFFWIDERKSKQVQHSTRISPLASQPYRAIDIIHDNRFRNVFSAVQSIVTSNAQNDNGLFETNMHDDRYLPFEGAGAEST